MNNDFDAQFDAAGRKYDVDPGLIKTVFHLESGGNPDIRDSAQGAQGGMQIIPSTAAKLGVNPRDMPQAIDGATRYLAEGLDATGTPQGALAYYHGGPDRSLWGPRTAAYVAKGQGLYPGMAVTTKPQQAAPADPRAADGEAIYKQMTGEAPAPAAKAAPADPRAADGEAIYKQMTAGADGPAPPPAEPGLDPVTGYPLDGRGVPLPGKPTTLAGQDQGTVVPTPKIPEAAADRIGQAVADAWHSENPLMSAAMQKTLDRPGLENWTGRYITSPLLQAGGAVLRGGAALGAGAAAAIGEGAGALGAPGLGRDLNMLMQVAPFARVGTGMPLAPGGAKEAKPAPRYVGERYGELTPDDTVAAPLSEEFLANPGTPANRLTAAAPVSEVPVAPQTATEASPTTGPPGAPAPRDAGAAATPPALAGMTPAEVEAYRSTAEGSKLIEQQQPGIKDNNIYVPGVTPNAAEVEQTVNTARELKALNITAPEVSQEAVETAARNSEKREAFFDNLARSKVDIVNAETKLAAQDERDLAAAWASKTDANAQPVLDRAAEIKRSPDGRRPAVREAVDAVTKELYDSNGDLITDPEQLYGVRKHIDDLLSDEGLAKRPLTARVKAHLLDLKSTLDASITGAAPAFGQYLENTAASRREIDTMKVLQQHRNGLFDSKGRMTHNKVQTMMRQIVDSRASDDPLNPYKSIPDETMAQLWNLRNDLRRSASAQELASVRGSDTAQNAWDTVKGVAGSMAGDAALHGAANYLLGPGMGSAAVLLGKNAIKSATSGSAARKRTARGMELLHPDPNGPLGPRPPAD